MIERILKQNIEKELFKGKAIILMGSRQTGKTTILMEMCPENEETLWMRGDDIGDQSRLENMTTPMFR